MLQSYTLIIGVSVFGVGALAFGAYALFIARKSAALAKTVDDERQLTATLEQAVAKSTQEVEDAQRALHRMWRLGQQITLELDPTRVLARFLEAAVDIVPADGGALSMIGEDGKLHIVATAGVAEPLDGMQIALAGSVAGSVIRSGRRWTARDILASGDSSLDPAVLARLDGAVRGAAIVPIARRGERIGAVTIASKEERLFTSAELERVEAMADLLSLALDNAELVDTLRQAEWRFRTLFRAAPDAVLTVLRSGRIREANDAVVDVTGLEPLQVVGRALEDLVAEPDRAKLTAALDAAFEGTAARLEVAVLHTQGKRRFVELAISRLPQADPPSVLLVGRDMTSEREMRLRLMESDRLAAVGELVAGVAHEVNNPLSSISAFAQLMLRDEELSPSQRDSLEVIKAETMRASQVVKDLLAFARRSEPQREHTDLNAVVARTLRLRSYEFSSNDIAVEQELADDLPAVLADARQLQQVVLNLLTNATQAMVPLGGGRLTVVTRAEDSAVVIEIRDTGAGIPDAVRDHIFEPFFTTKKEGEGTGLGLSVSYGIVTAHRGRIEVADTSAHGTTFRVTLPAVEAPSLELAPPEIPSILSRSPLAGMRLLFVDREPALRSGLESFGALRGFKVVTASDGAQALEVLHSMGVDAVVCDLRMAAGDGGSFHERLRRDRPGLAARTVFLTEEVIVTGRAPVSRQPVIMKPFAFERLEEALVAVMRGVPYVATA